MLIPSRSLKCIANSQCSKYGHAGEGCPCVQCESSETMPCYTNDSQGSRHSCKLILACSKAKSNANSREADSRGNG